jgi:broad specificity phosphatase PhoE
VPRITLVRHGKAAAGWEDSDPPLDDAGRAEAEAMAAAIGGGARTLITSPLRRARETAAALEQLWGVTAIVEPHFGEVVAPDEYDVSTRVNWLRGFLGGTYTDAGVDYCVWRDEILATLRALTDDAVIVSHFVAINAAIGKALGEDRVVCQPVGNCSRTTIDIDPITDEWKVVAMGEAAQTVVN